MPSAENPTFPVLLVDDEPEVLEDAGAILLSRGIRNVTSMGDSREVLGFLENRRVSVAIVDIMMPHVSGTELLAAILAYQKRERRYGGLANGLNGAIAKLAGAPAIETLPSQ